MASFAKPIVLGITGRIGAGKTTVGHYLAERYGFQYIRYSQVLADWLTERPESREGLQKAGWDVMDGGLQPELNRRLIAQIDPAHNCAVDGLRHIVDFESLSTEFLGRFFLAFIECTPDLRWLHVKLKGRTLTMAEFRDFDDHHVEQRIDDLKKNAFAVVPNLGSPRDLQQQVDSVLERLAPGGQP
jgi:dephospho-CoA kinase